MTARVLGPQSLLGSWVVREEAQQLTTMQQRAGIIPGPLFLLLPQVLIQAGLTQDLLRPSPLAPLPKRARAEEC
ncbi:MAG: hypothetical protein BJG00_010370 [Limnothrix sp. CACIAM 69d]|nr:MAG: hypothetical protein BJG00_010370 [Limnothrix sp. CACIAM 69d]